MADSKSIFLYSYHQFISLRVETELTVTGSAPVVHMLSEASALWLELASSEHEVHYDVHSMCIMGQLRTRLEKHDD